MKLGFKKKNSIAFAHLKQNVTITNCFPLDVHSQLNFSFLILTVTHRERHSQRALFFRSIFQLFSNAKNKKIKINKKKIIEFVEKKIESDFFFKTLNFSNTQFFIFIFFLYNNIHNINCNLYGNVFFSF